VDIDRPTAAAIFRHRGAGAAGWPTRWVHPQTLLYIHHARIPAAAGPLTLRQQ
jgi:hypothetical protein